MNFSLRTWVGQVTTAHGVMILGPTFMAVASGTMTWPTALPLLTAGVVGLLWPENSGLKTATQNVVADVETLIAAYRTGLRQSAADTDAETHSGTTPRSSVPTVGACAALMAAGLILSACANQTPMQQASAGKAIASGLLCLADASGRVVATATTDDPASLKAINSAVAAGGALLTDADCQTAIVNGVAAMPDGKPAVP